MSSPRLPNSQTPILILLAAFILLGAIYAVVTPFFEISDELWHYPMVKTIADGNGLPVQNPANPGPWRQEGSQPPLYYALMALATFWIDTSDMEQVRWVNPHADNGLITQDRNNNIIIHTDREQWPPLAPFSKGWRGTVLAVRLIRLLSVLLGAGTVYFTYRLALELLPEGRRLALAAAALTAFTPMFVFITASVNNDNLAIFCSAGALWLLARWLRRPPQNIGWEHVGLGVLLGCGALSKQSALGLFPLAGLVLLFPHLRSKRPFLLPSSSFLLSLLTVFGLAALIAFWWYLRNYQLYGDWLGWNSFLDTVGRRPHPASLWQLWGERVGFAQAYWGLFGGVSVAMPAWVYTLLNLIMALALVGLLIGLIEIVTRPNPSTRSAEICVLLSWALPVSWIILILIGLVRWTSLTWASQGRLIFPAISAISLLAVVGLAQLARTFHFPPSTFLLPPLTFMAVLSAAVPFTIIAPHYAPPPELAPEQIAALPHRLDADFGGEMTLLGYQLEADSARPGESIRLTLYWQSQIRMDRNWSIFVHLVDDAGVIFAQRDRYPGQGALATTLLTPGQTLADEYVIPIPAAAYAPVNAHIEVGLYDLLDGARLPLSDGSDALSLAPLAIRARADSLPNAIHQNFGNLIELSGYEMGERALRPGETLHLTLYWQALRPIPDNYAVFAHVRGEGETLWAGQDAWPQKGNAPTALWPVGQIISDTYELTLKPDTPPGQYNVEVGLYGAESFQRLRAFNAEGYPTDADFVFLSQIRVGLP
jgi:4-amino-4-deoxy-L-arabinose transferase-like glycosyltransferase